MKQREIKFRYRYTDGHNWIMPVFTLKQIVNGEPFEVTSDNALLRRYKHVGEDQYTGLKDAKGKEIYEGDIIRFKVNFPGQKYDDGVVRWADGGWWTSQHEEDLEEMLSDELRDLEGTVIGNIYENPELKP